MKNRIHISPSWSFRDDSGHKLDQQLFALLKGIYQEGKLTAAAKAVGISYRHSWNLLNKWSAFFGADLVNLQKGRGAQLTPLGEKLLWAEQRVAARLLPQMENLASELNIEIQRAMQDASPLLRLHASHGYAVALLPQFADHFQLDIQYKSPADALAALNRGTCDLAGFHLPAGIHSTEALQRYQPHLKPRAHRIIRFISRRMGLMVAPGNPKSLSGLTDLADSSVRFINRQKDSGSRALFDQLLQEQGLTATQIPGYNDEEFTHSAVAAFVGAGMADAGFGVEAAARQFGLDFVPLAQEHYLLICHHQGLSNAAMSTFLETIRSEAFLAALKDLPGYSPQHCGEIYTLDELLQAGF